MKLHSTPFSSGLCIALAVTLGGCSRSASPNTYRELNRLHSCLAKTMSVHTPPSPFMQRLAEKVDIAILDKQPPQEIKELQRELSQKIEEWVAESSAAGIQFCLSDFQKATKGEE